VSKTARTTLLVALGLVIVLVLAGAFFPLAFGRGYSSGWGMMGPGMMGGYGFSIFGMLIPVLLLILVVAGVVWLAQGLGRGSSSPPAAGSSAESPLDILKRRYAQGEITKEQFEQMKRDLGMG